MAIGKASDFIIYNAEFQTGMVEGLNQNIALFNEGTRGAIVLKPRALKGHYSKEAFFEDVASLVTRRDTTSTAAVTDIALTQGENISVKINRKVGPVAQTLDAMKKAGMSVEDASRAFGFLAATRKLKDMVNAALIAGEAAIQANTLMNLDVSAETPDELSTSILNRGRALFGDAAGDIVCWVMHSKPYFDVMGGLITDKVTNLADLVTIGGDVPALLGKAYVVSDASCLYDANGTAEDTYNTLGLVRGAITVEESEPDTFATEIVTGLENLVQRWQSEHAFNVSVKGFQWDVANGGANPSDATLGTGSNWDQTAYDDKLTAGVRIVSA